MTASDIRGNVRTLDAQFARGHGADTEAKTMAERISDKLVKGMVPPPSGNRIVYDDEVRGFGVRITANGTRAFVLNYRHDAAGTGRRTNEFRVTLGGYPAWSVAAARDEARKLKQRIDKGENPLAERQAKRAVAKAEKLAETYEEAVEDYIKREQIGRRQNATAAQVRQGLLREGKPWLKRPVGSIAAAEIRRRLEAIRDGDESAKVERAPVSRQPALCASQRILPVVRRARHRPREGQSNDRAPAAVGGRGSPAAVLLRPRAAGDLAGGRRDRRPGRRLREGGDADRQAPGRALGDAVGGDRRQRHMDPAAGPAAAEEEQARPSGPAVGAGAAHPRAPAQGRW